jgi:ubiquinone/menaquinone biosynthesis C-methylase UbiE
MNRIIEPELLDTLSLADPRAVRSRLDLRRVNAWMGHHNIMTFALQKCLPGRPPGQVTDLGAGDGNFLLRVAQKIQAGQASRPAGSAGTKATLLDRQNNVSTETLAAFAALGWQAETLAADVFNWPQVDGDIVIANLFLHHFKSARLAELFRLISRRARVFIALEPRRAELPLLCSRLLWAIGCNEVTRHDAVVSVRAGFSGGELSALWPEPKHWELTERRAGLFSHLFIAKRKD